MPEITIPASDQSGSFSAYLAKPKAEKAPALILIQEIFGVNANMRAQADHYAGLGFLAVCPDLFWRQKPGVQLTDKTKEEWDQALKYMKGFNIDKGIEDLSATLAHLRNHENGTGKAGCVGFCLGGKLAFLMAANTDCDASVSYYGVGFEQLADVVQKIKRPMLIHVAGKDRFSSPEARAQYEPAMKANPMIEYHLYADADHAFARIDGEHYEQTAANLANARTDVFLRKHLL